MKKFAVFCFAGIAALVLASGVFAQTPSVRGQSLNGSTGLFSIPSGRIGWDRSSDLGLDFSFHSIINTDDGIRTAYIPALTASLFKWVEVSLAYDIQPDIDVLKTSGKNKTGKNDDLLFGFKVQMPTNIKNPKNPAIALGTNIQFINCPDDDNDTGLQYRYNAYQPYLAATYAGTFFNMPAETTVVIGKTLYSGGPANNSDIDFGMGFDLVLFPDVFENFVHWIIDFANFNYSDNAWPNGLVHASGSSWYRGILNTGLRIDLGQLPALKKSKFVIDVIFNDLFDHENRSFTVGGTFGFLVLDAK
jgi:hypothetical protein